MSIHTTPLTLNREGLPGQSIPSGRDLSSRRSEGSKKGISEMSDRLPGDKTERNRLGPATGERSFVSAFSIRQDPGEEGDRCDDSVCLLYTSDAADERSSVDLGGRRIIKK